MKISDKIRLFTAKIATLVTKIFASKQEIHYINGPETLPAPLEPEEEQEIFARIIGGDESAREPLITHNLRLVVYIAKKFESSGVGIEDLIPSAGFR